MDNLKKWFNRCLTNLSFALINVEKNALGQNKETLMSDTQHVKRHTEGQLIDSLVHGEVTQEVINLRWRTYKILKETEKFFSEIVGYDNNGNPITNTKRREPKKNLKKIKIDTYDDYPLEMVLDNSEIIINMDESINNDNIKLLDESVENYDENGNLINVTHGSISSNEYFATNKGDRPIKIEREIIPNFFIENYTKKLNIRAINETEKLLEFYISKYPDEYNRTSRLIISEIKKIMSESKNSNMLEFDLVNFITYKTIGSIDFLFYNYQITSFDKVVEFDGYYVIKFKSKVINNGEDILEKYRVEDLDKKYLNKERKIK